MTSYIAGAGGHRTRTALVISYYPALSLLTLVDGVTHGQDIFSKTIAYTESPLVQSAGGELLKLDDGMFYLMGGHVFMGTYREFEGADERTLTRHHKHHKGNS